MSSQTPRVKGADSSLALLGDRGSFKNWSLVGVVWVTGVMTLENTMRWQLWLHSLLSLNLDRFPPWYPALLTTAATVMLPGELPTPAPKQQDQPSMGLEHLKL